MPSLVKAAMATVLISVTALACTLPANAVETSGQGGAFTDRLNQSFTARNGLTSQHHIYAAGIPQGKAAGLLLQFHGDGAYEFQNPNSSYSLGGSEGIVSQARKRGYITVPVLAPDRSGSVTWWESGSANADYVADLVNSLKGQYNIESEDIWLVGFSGGAQFITQFYLPRHANQIDGGGSVVFGGGGSPRVTANAFAPDLVKDFPMHWYTGANDTVGFDALGAARAGANWYSGRDFKTNLESPAGVDHNLSGRFGPVVARHLDDHVPNTGGAPSAPTPPRATTPAPSPTTKAPTASPTPRPTPPGPISDWKHSVRANRTSVHLQVNIPSNVRRTTLRVEALNGRGHSYTYTTRTGERTLTIQNRLRPHTEYRYTVVADGRTVALGTFRTTR